MALLSDYVDEVERLPTESLLADVAPEGLSSKEARGRALSDRAPELGCNKPQLASLMAPGLAEITPDGPVAERYLEIVLQSLGLDDRG